MSSEPSDQNREPVTRRLDELAQQVKYLRELIDAAYAEERRQYSAFFRRSDRRNAPQEIARRHPASAVHQRRINELRTDQPNPKKTLSDDDVS
jgi:hypothetical protein